jgi:hypothetical protein
MLPANLITVLSRVDRVDHPTDRLDRRFRVSGRVEWRAGLRGICTSYGTAAVPYTVSRGWQSMRMG